IPLVVDDEVRADRPRRRAPGLDHRGERNAAPGLAPVLGGFEDIFVGCEHWFPSIARRVGKGAADAVPTALQAGWHAQAWARFALPTLRFGHPYGCFHQPKIC